jgi:uncharacterized DUF497 family protein
MKNTVIDEEGWITLGLVASGQYLLVMRTFEEYSGTADVRIISARKAHKDEIREYEGDKS